MPSIATSPGKGKDKEPSTEAGRVDATPEAEEILEEVFGLPRGKRNAEIPKAPMAKRPNEVVPKIPTVVPIEGIKGSGHFAEYLSRTRSVSEAQALASLNHKQRLDLARSHVAMVSFGSWPFSYICLFSLLVLLMCY